VPQKTLLVTARYLAAPNIAQWLFLVMTREYAMACSPLQGSTIMKACRSIVLLPHSACLQLLRIEKREREKALIERERKLGDIQNVERRNL
jgi:hypothetical protein